MILDEYCNKMPNYQNEIDIFKGEWSSKFPDRWEIINDGNARLFEDDRIKWYIDKLKQLGKESKQYVSTCRILELGPLEGGHTFMLTEKGYSVTAIEANQRAYMKCLITSNLFMNWSLVNLHLGDFNKYLENSKRQYDSILACGVLYHQQYPEKLIEQISKHTDNVFIWTHYFDEVLYKRFPGKFGELETWTYQGNQYQSVRQKYLDALNWNGFCGGIYPDSVWLTRDSLIRLLDNYGFVNKEYNFDTFDHPNGPAIAIMAWK